MSELITLESVFLGVIATLMSFAVWASKSYITRDDEWKRDVDKELAGIAALRTTCMQEFAYKKDLNEAFNVLRIYGERLAALESKNAIYSKKD